MSEVLSMPWKRLVEQVEVAAAGGNDRAVSLLRKLLEHEAAGGDLNNAIMRLACRPPRRFVDRAVASWVTDSRASV